MEELITKNLEVKDNLKPRFHNEFDIVQSTFLSRPIALRLWASFFVILPIFVQAPWVRVEPISALCATFIILAALVLWFISKEIFNSAIPNSINGKALLVSSYVIQTTLIVDGIFIVLAIIQPTLSGLV